MTGDGADDQPPLIRTANIATPLSGLIRSSIEFVYEHRGRFGDTPTTGSLAHKEWAKDTRGLSSHRQLDIEAAHETAAGIYILSAAYFLTALARLLSADMELFAYQVVARSVVECAAKAWWLNDSDATADERLGRFYEDRLNNIEEMVRAERLPKSDLTLRRKQLVARARRSGLEQKLSKKGRSYWLWNCVEDWVDRTRGTMLKCLRAPTVNFGTDESPRLSMRLRTAYSTTSS